MSDERWAGRPGPITPAAGIGENILLRRLKKYFLYRVLFREGLPPGAALVRDFGAIGAGVTVAQQSLQAQLELTEDQIGQFRFFPLDDSTPDDLAAPVFGIAPGQEHDSHRVGHDRAG